MRVSVIAAFATLIAASVAVAQISITQPTVGTVWNTGSQVQIFWAAANGGALLNGPITFNLLWGNASDFQDLGALVTAPNENTGSVRFVLQSNLPTSNQYTIRSGSAYSPLFTIENANNQTPATNTTTFPVFTPAQAIGQTGSANSASGTTIAGAAAALVGVVAALLV